MILYKIPDTVSKLRSGVFKVHMQPDNNNGRHCSFERQLVPAQIPRLEKFWDRLIEIRRKETRDHQSVPDFDVSLRDGSTVGPRLVIKGYFTSGLGPEAEQTKRFVRDFGKFADQVIDGRRR